MATKLSVSIDVPNLEAATAFYVDALECVKLREQGRTMVVLSAGNADIYLLERSADTNPLAASGTDGARSYARHWTPVHLDFVVSDVDAAASRVVAAGGVREGGEEGEWGAIAHCVDPFGHGFCVIRE